ncbi:HgcAB-associated protein HgcC [Dehalogenimonas etheniformans]|uniref:AbrB/MazE/SpoVT family DNA-binding domain-containing protein n=1 Tax=Dehalogenimonas etheniformans TaxID=1536648 RepID=A0A2P5P6Q4_9CHLR|nr:HgcAB-associated protein [Dehalogenimonas etheniformans]PPD57982.1 AbrB/MazE/SpoVT family DNA-binding domain-containing protein [Dehalogenimonas etheniformans]QNT75333.1 AbrB/MazE/SpoVT family DNA-binding domain-containing protein [Dehalogenimonas etheniformans]
MPENSKSQQGACCETTECCRVEAVVSVDARGQVVLPKEIRDGMGIAAGDKLALVTLSRGGKPCCLVMTKAENLAKSARDLLGPLIKEI